MAKLYHRHPALHWLALRLLARGRVPVLAQLRLLPVLARALEMARPHCHRLALPCSPRFRQHLRPLAFLLSPWQRLAAAQNSAERAAAESRLGSEG
jgi:hypothetical protein